MPRPYLSVALRASVIARAEGRCEYCLIQIVGKTPEGRATVQLLRLNAAERFAQRQFLIRVGRYQVPG
ncbi:MAG: hypothetical protein D3915_15030 [Candidatus Electrothrix sp. AU1_5]|nr:hypothetical protein [Candidatus Electrothrix gigas]